MMLQLQLLNIAAVAVVIVDAIAVVNAVTIFNVNAVAFLTMLQLQL